MTNEANPARDYAYLFIPYCCGDVHVGNGEIESLELRFNGANNTRAALEWVYAQVPAPDTVLTVGCSAGSLGATVFSRWVADHYRSALCASLGDSYVGVMTADWWRQLDENWELFDSFYPAPGLEPEVLREFRPDVVGYIGEMYARDDPGNPYAQFTYNADIVQTAFTALAGGNPLTWTAQMRAIVPTFLEAPNSAAAIASGGGHCTTNLGSFYSLTIAGVPFVEWVAALLRGALPADWRFLDDLAGVNASADVAAAATATAATAAAAAAEAAEAERMHCAARFVAEVGGAWERNLTRHNKHLYLRHFHRACPGFAAQEGGSSA
jgi:hypothetical protein